MRHYVTYPEGQDDAVFHAQVSTSMDVESSETGETEGAPWVTYNLTTPEPLNKEDRETLAQDAIDYKFNVKNGDWDNYQGI